MKEIKALAIDSVSTSLSIALLNKNNIIENSYTNIRNHNTELLREIDKILIENNTNIDELNFIALGIGPGSFTALRIAFATVKGICYSKNIKVIGVSSLEALYKNIESLSGIKIAMIDARKESVYCSIYKDKEIIKKDIDITYDNLASLLASLNITSEIVVCGDGYTNYKEKIDKLFLAINISIKNIDEDNNIIHAKNILSLANERYNNDTDDIFTLNPVYLRKSEAEIHLDNLNNNKK